ncbi:MAG: hypothetical protein Q9169_005392 [Polycauliona sp. 2 TL-2023]
MSSFSKVEPKYEHLEDTRLMDDSSSDSDLPMPKKTSKMAMLGIAVPWALCAALLVLLAASWAFQWSNECSGSTFERGFDTELVPAKSQISMQKVKYRGTPIFGDDGKEFVEYEPGEKKYVGEPSDEIDDAWNELTVRRFFLLSEAEAKAQFGPGYKNLDMFHTLHCLDHIRKSLYPKYYHQTSLHGKIHNGHCMDHIRQQIMCQSDLTPLPSQYFESRDTNYLDSDREHTCRDFSAIREWTHMRYNQSLKGDEVWTGHYEEGHEGTSSFGPM